MVDNARQRYTFRGASPEQVADLCDLWQGSVVEFDPHRGTVQVESDPISFDQFVMFYELVQCLDESGPVDTEQSDWTL